MYDRFCLPSISHLSPVRFAKAYAPVNVGRIQKWIDDGRLDASKPISAHELYASRCIHDYHDGVKVLGDGAHQLRDPIQLVVSRASSQAIAAVEAAGGTIVCKYYTRTSLEALVKPDKYYGRLLPRDPDPIAKKELGECLCVYICFACSLHSSILYERRQAWVPFHTPTDATTGHSIAIGRASRVV